MSFSFNSVICLRFCKCVKYLDDGRVICRINGEDYRTNADADKCPYPNSDRFAEARSRGLALPIVGIEQPSPPLIEQKPTVVRERHGEFTAADAERLLSVHADTCMDCPHHRGSPVKHVNYPHPIDATIFCAVAPQCCGVVAGSSVSLVYGRCPERRWEKARAAISAKMAQKAAQERRLMAGEASGSSESPETKS